MNKQTTYILIIGVVLAVAGTLLYAIYPDPAPVADVTDQACTEGITSPLSGMSIDSPVTVAGTASVFENQFTISVVDGNGEEIGTTQAYAYGDIGITPAVFVEEVSFTTPSTATGTIEIWSASAKDGSKYIIDSLAVNF